MTDRENPTGWRKSSFSDTTNCVEVRSAGAGTVDVRNSNDTDGGRLTFSSAQMATWVAGCRAGEFDDLT